MNRWTLIWRSVCFYRRTHVGVLLAAAVATAVLTGALAVGDSIGQSLRRQALARVGGVRLALAPPDYLFRAELADELGRQLNAPAAAVLRLGGMASAADSSARANDVVLLGVDESFWKLAPVPRAPALPEDGAILGEALARQLRVSAGDSIVIRVAKPSLLPRDAPLSSDRAEDVSFAANLTVTAVADDNAFGRFGLQADQFSPYNAFVPLDWLRRRAGQAGRANLLLIGGDGEGGPAVAQAAAALGRSWRLADGNIELRHVEGVNMLELRSSRIFLADPVVLAARQARQPAIGVLTYFVNEISSGERSTPYSMVAGVGFLPQPAETAPASGATSAGDAGPLDPLPGDLTDDQIVVNDWLANDLSLKSDEANARIELSYFVLGPLREMLTRHSAFALRGQVPMRHLAADHDLMPDFPGIADSPNCRDWHAGIDIAFDKIRPADEKYWADFRGTPKAFVSLAAAQKMWGNRYGSLTAVRWQAAGRDAPALARAIESRLDCGQLGFVWQDVGAQALASASPTTDFASLFLGLSIFLVVAALLLSGLLFAFAAQQRTAEVGTLLALGFTPREVRRLLMFEVAVLSAIGSILGVAAGLGYTKLMLLALGTLWPQAVGSAVISFSVHGATLAMALVAGTLAAMAAMWLVLRRQAKQPARVLLTGEVESSAVHKRPRLRGRRRVIWGIVIAVCLLGGVWVPRAGMASNTANLSAWFFGGGTLMLIGLLLLAREIFFRSSVRRLPVSSLGGLASRNTSWRPGRSLVTVGLLMCGTFLVVAVGANRHDAASDAYKRTSGTGGFALMGRCSIPIQRDLDRPDGQEAFGLAGKVQGARFVGLSVRSGARADCLNLNRVAAPEVLGVEAAQFERRGAFTFVKAMPGADESKGWALLDEALPGGDVPAVADENTITWALGKKPGDAIEYVDDSGKAVRLRLVAMIGNSILQGSLVISRDQFLRHFASEGGSRMLLVDCPRAQEDEVSALLTRQLWPVGLEMTPASQRRAELSAVENSYLSMFQVLGGLGLVLGSAGLALVVLRNVMERRGELALMRAVGFSRKRIARLVLVEHLWLLGWGLLGGAGSGVLAAVPALAGPGKPFPNYSLTATVLAVAVSGAVWTWLAVGWSLRGNLLEALRNE